MKKHLKPLVLGLLLLITLAVPVRAAEIWMGDSAWDVDYNVEVSAPDGGVNFRRGPGTDYEKLIDHMIPNGYVLHISREATASNGNNWGFTKYNGLEGWIALTQVSLTTSAAPESAPQNEIVFERFYENSFEFATVTKYDGAGNAVWQYKTESYAGAQCNHTEKIGCQNGYYYLVEDGAILALSEETGILAWKNEEFKGGATEKGNAFDKDGNLYICGCLGPDLFAVDKEGNTLYRKDTLVEGIYWPYQMEWKDEQTLVITFEGNPKHDGNSVSVEVNIKN